MNIDNRKDFPPDTQSHRSKQLFEMNKTHAASQAMKVIDMTKSKKDISSLSAKWQELKQNIFNF